MRSRFRSKRMSSRKATRVRLVLSTSSQGSPCCFHTGDPWSQLVALGGEAILRPCGFRRRKLVFGTDTIDTLEGFGRGGPDVIFLHGLGDRNSTWHRVLFQMRKGPWGRILAPDLIGSGRSLLASGAPMPTLAQGIEKMRQLLAISGCKEPILVGNSLGGWLAWRFIHAYPEAVAGALLLAPAGFMEPAELGTLTRRFIDGEAEEMAAAIMADARPEVRFFARRIVAHLLKSPVVAEMCSQDASELLCRPGELAGLRDRLRVLWGRQDTLMPERSLEVLRAELGDRVVLDDVGHAAQQTRPGMVLRELTHLVEQFRRDVPSAQVGAPDHLQSVPAVAPAPRLGSEK